MMTGLTAVQRRWSNRFGSARRLSRSGDIKRNTNLQIMDNLIEYKPNTFNIEP
jgi:hypothetical protein